MFAFRKYHQLMQVVLHSGRVFRQVDESVLDRCGLHTHAQKFVGDNARAIVALTVLALRGRPVGFGQWPGAKRPVRRSRCPSSSPKPLSDDMASPLPAFGLDLAEGTAVGFEPSRLPRPVRHQVVFSHSLNARGCALTTLPGL